MMTDWIMNAVFNAVARTAVDVRLVFSSWLLISARELSGQVLSRPGCIVFCNFAIAFCDCARVNPKNKDRGALYRFTRVSVNTFIDSFHGAFFRPALLPKLCRSGVTRTLPTANQLPNRDQLAENSDNAHCHS
jgi:hypothetical protein